MDIYQTQISIGAIKELFQSALKKNLGLKRVSAPLFVKADCGLNDGLSGSERPVRFDIPALKCEAEIVHSLAKWKRVALKKYGFQVGDGLYTDMNAIRRDEVPDSTHSIYVDQWDWERVISRDDRTIEYLKGVVLSIVNSIFDVSAEIGVVTICPTVTFITTEELEKLYPGLSPKEREDEIVQKHKTVFIIGIGHRHEQRAPDYDDWELNGDLLFWHEAGKMALEISSMGIRVDKKSLRSQLEIAGKIDMLKHDYHKGIMEGTLPLTIGGGIGQSRLCMLLLGKRHIGEVQASIWEDSEGLL